MTKHRYFRLDYKNYKMGNLPYTSFHFTEQLANDYRRLCTSATWWEVHEINVEDRDVPFLECSCAGSKERVEKENGSLSRHISNLFKNYK